MAAVMKRRTKRVTDEVMDECSRVVSLTSYHTPPHLNHMLCQRLLVMAVLNCRPIPRAPGCQSS